MDERKADNFLRLIRRAQRGKLKIYLGYAAGVGKTYQMLLEGHRIVDDGIDLVVGVVETHGRTGTESLLAGLPIMARRNLAYRGIVIEEMDLEAILARHPSVVLVDELAHTNVPGSKNAKRYQDVEELLAAGIHVISTLNVQHIESLYETVEQATSVRVRERIPDRIVGEADQIVNVDITIEDLRRRLREGKVYTQERIEAALDHFFKPSNLEQLRELTLRELAAQIDARRRDPLSEESPPSPDQVMVALSSRGPNSAALLRYASRLAGRLNRNWYAVYVQTARERPLAIDATTQRRLADTLALAQQLGAVVFTYKGEDVVKALLQFAKEYRVGHLVIGSPGTKPTFWNRLWKESSVVERLISARTGLTIVVLDTAAIQENSGYVQQREAKEEPTTRPQQRQQGQIRGTVFSDLRAAVWHQSIGKEAAIASLLEVISGLDADLRQRAWTSILERERQGGTHVSSDVAVPHARVAGLIQPRVAIGVCGSGIEDHETAQSSKIVILLLSPTEPPEKHLEALGLIAKIARDDAWRKRILEADKASEVKQVTLAWISTNGPKS